MDTRARGDIAEAAVLTALTQAGLSVWLPWSRFGPCDLLAETSDQRIFRVQVKAARFRDCCVISNCRSTDHGTGRKSYLGLADVLALHVPDLGEQFVVPVAEAHGFELRLRVHPTRNNQRLRVRHAHDYRLADWAARVGCQAEVRSSCSPLTTTTSPGAS